MIDKMDAKIDFREQNTSAGTFASQWVYQKDFIKLKVEEDEAILMKPIETSSYCDVILIILCHKRLVPRGGTKHVAERAHDRPVRRTRFHRSLERSAKIHRIWTLAKT